MEKSMYKLDAGESAFFANQLNHIKASTYDEKNAPVSYREAFPVSAEAEGGATEITWRQYKGIGMAKIIADYAKDFPRTDIGGIEHTVKVKHVGSSYAYSILEIRRASMAGVPLEQRRATMCRESIERKLNALAWNGDAKAQIQGFIKYPGTSEYTVPATGTGTTKTWATKTGLQMLTDLNGIRGTVLSATNNMEQIDTILMPFAQLELLKNTLIGTASDTTVYEFFKKNNPGIEIMGVRELDGAGTGGIDMMIAYVRKPTHITFELPIAFEQLDAEKEGMEYKVPAFAGTAGIIMYYPLACAWGEGL